MPIWCVELLKVICSCSHAAILPALIYRLSFVGRPFVYDIRAFVGQWVDGRLRFDSFAFRVLAALKADYPRSTRLVVLDPRVKSTYWTHSVPLETYRITDLAGYRTSVVGAEPEAQSELDLFFWVVHDSPTCLWLPFAC